MTEAQIQLQNALTTTFLANMAFLSEYDNELYHKVDELSCMIASGSYKEKYELEFITEDGDFDIYDVINDKYLYNRKPKKINSDLIRKSELDTNNSMFNISEYFFLKEKENISLSIKEISDSPAKKFQDAYKIGDIVKGTVKDAKDFGIFIKLENTLDGLISFEEICSLVIKTCITIYPWNRVFYIVFWFISNCI